MYLAQLVEGELCTLSPALVVWWAMLRSHLLVG
jgi:hypothetical protein